MSKKNNQGFLLAESLIVSTFVLTVITLIFIQFKNIMVNNKRHYTYNSIENIYNLGSLADYLKANENPSNTLSNALSTSTDKYYKVYDGTNCASEVLNTGMQTGCKTLASAMDLKYAIYTDSNVETVKNNITNIDQDMRDFIEKIDATKITGKGRLFAKFKNGSFATIAMDQKEVVQTIDRTVYYSLGDGNNLDWWNKIDTDSTNTYTYTASTRMNNITVKTKSGWDQLYIPLETKPNTSYKLTFQYEMGSFTYLDSSHQGIACQILAENINANASDPEISSSDHQTESMHITTYLLKSGAKGTAIIDFTSDANTNITYLVLNFGYAANNKTINAKIGDFKMVKNIGAATTYGEMAIPLIDSHPFKSWKDNINGTGTEIRSTSAVSPSLFTKNATTGIYEQTVAATY